MALDSMRKFKEVKKPVEKSLEERNEELKELLSSIDDIDQKWIRENETNEDIISIPSPTFDDEEKEEDLVELFRIVRELNNDDMRKKRDQQIENLKKNIDSIFGR